MRLSRANPLASPALKRLLYLIRGVGVVKTLAVGLGTIDDQYFRTFDRRYRVRTSGHIVLSTTSFEPSKLRDATSYGPVNAWAFRDLLKKLNLPKTWHFVDLGCGLGRACLLAAEYGFEKVTGVELAPELCTTARENVASYRFPASVHPPVNIIQGDVLDYCEQTEDDLFFIYRAFSLGFFRIVREKLAERAVRQKKLLTIIYSQRLDWAPSHEVKEFSADPKFRHVFESNHFGQEFHVYQCGWQFSPTPSAAP
jgi:SAM-dependent methyltransferase